MKIKLIRNATIRINYSGKELIVDPFLAPRYAIESFAGVSKNPAVDLPCAPEEAVNGVEMVIVSHLHPDHFDQLAADLLPFEIPLFCQPGDEENLKQIGFRKAYPITGTIIWEGITIMRTPGQHGTGVWAEQMGNVSGFVFRADNEPVVYWAGDTVLTDEVVRVLNDFEPDVIITHSGGARFEEDVPIIMDDEQTIELCLEYPNKTFVATHLEALDHCPVTRTQLRELARKSDIPDETLLIPEDGETIEL